MTKDLGVGLSILLPIIVLACLWPLETMLGAVLLVGVFAGLGVVVMLAMTIGSALRGGHSNHTGVG